MIMTEAFRISHSTFLTARKSLETMSKVFTLATESKMLSQLKNSLIIQWWNLLFLR